MKERASCPLCESGSPTTKLTLQYDEPPLRGFLKNYYGDRFECDVVSDGEYVIEYCSPCDFYWKRFVLDDEGLSKLYSQWVPDAMADDGRGYSWRSTKRRVELVSRLESFFDESPSELTFLDYGFGWASMSKVAQAFGFDVYGYELSAEKRRFAEQHGITCLSTIEEVASGDFDFIHVNQVLEHLTGINETMACLESGLADDGLCYLAVPNADHPGPMTERTATDVNAFHPLEHVNGFTPTSLRRLGRQFGLEPVNPLPTMTLSIPRQLIRYALEGTIGKPFLYRVLSSLSPDFTPEQIRRTLADDGHTPDASGERDGAGRLTGPNGLSTERLRDHFGPLLDSSELTAVLFRKT